MSHTMSTPQSLNDLAEALHHEIRETRQHCEGVINNNGTAQMLLKEGAENARVAFGDDVIPASHLIIDYRSAVTRYQEGVSQAIDGLLAMKKVVERAHRQEDESRARGRRARAVSRRSI